MSLWYDIKNKVYSSGPMDNWYISYLSKVCDTLTNSIRSMFTNHTEGSISRHKAEHIDYDEGITLRDAFDNEAAARYEGDQNLQTQLDAHCIEEAAARHDGEQQLLAQLNSHYAEEATAREAGLSLKVDKEAGKQLSTNDYTNEEKEALAKTAGKKVEGDIFSVITLYPNGNVMVTPTSEICHEGSEIFNDYSSNQAQGFYSHAEGQYTSAQGDYSHTEGVLTTANGMCSHAEGQNTCAGSKNQHVQGILNITDTEHKYAHIVGNGHYDVDSDYNEHPVRSNAHTLDWQGNAWFAGDVFCGENENGLLSQINALYNLRPTVLTEVSDTLKPNTIYDLGESATLSLTLPDGNTGDWIKVDFISGDTPTELSVITDSISDYSITPEANTIYSLYFDWGRLSADTYGWRFAYSEYTKVVSK